MVEVIVAAISAAALIIAAAIPAYVQLSKGLASVKQDTKVTKNEVKNSHQTNLREELDGRHERVLAGLENIGHDIRGLRTDIVTLFSQDRELRLEVIDNRDRLDRLDKRPPAGKPPEAP